MDVVIIVSVPYLAADTDGVRDDDDDDARDDDDDDARDDLKPYLSVTRDAHSRRRPRDLARATSSSRSTWSLDRKEPWRTSIDRSIDRRVRWGSAVGSGLEIRDAKEARTKCV